MSPQIRVVKLRSPAFPCRGFVLHHGLDPKAIRTVRGIAVWARFGHGPVIPTRCRNASSPPSHPVTKKMITTIRESTTAPEGHRLGAVFAQAQDEVPNCQQHSDRVAEKMDPAAVIDRTRLLPRKSVSWLTPSLH